MEKKRGNKKSVDLKRMCPQQKARNLAYAEPSKEVRAWMAASQQRVFSILAHERKKAWENNPLQELDSKLHHDTLIGQLKAAEARNRIRQMRLQCHNLKVGLSYNIGLMCHQKLLPAGFCFTFWLHSNNLLFFIVPHHFPFTICHWGKSFLLSTSITFTYSCEVHNFALM